MDKEKESRGSDLQRNCARFFPSSSSSSPSPAGFNNGRNGRGDGYAMESCKREGAKGLKWSSSEDRMDSKYNGGGAGGSEGEEGYILRSPLNANGISSRKRNMLQERKASDLCAPVDPALVPRRLRSAIKRINQSASPPSSDAKRRQQHASNGTPLFNSPSAERSKQEMLDEVTKDEKEVAEALTSMASLITISKPVKTKEDGRMLEENTEKKAPSAFPSEAPKEEGTKFLVPCNSTKVTNPFPCVENSPETTKADPSAQEQPTAASVSQNLNAEANVPSQPEPDSLRKLSSNMEPVGGVRHLKDAMNISNPLGASLQYFPGNGMLHPMQLDALLVPKQEPGFWPLGPDSMEHDLQCLKQKPECVSHDISRKAPDLQAGLHSRGHEKLTVPSSSKAAAYPNSITVSGQPRSRSGLPTEKLSLAPADKKRPWSRCITHVHLSHLIRDIQKAEKKKPSLPQANQSKAKEGTSCSLPTSGETVRLRNGVIPPLSGASLVERSMLEARNRMLQDGRLLQAQQAAAFSGAYAPQKQGCDLLSLSAAGDTKISWNGMKSSGQLHVSYPPNQAVMPFTFPQGAYTSQYQEQFAAGATQQVQMQQPTHIANSQLYGSHMGQSAGVASTKQPQQQLQQQLMWQAHYSSPLGFPQKWQQNGLQHDSSSSSSLLTQPPSIFPLPAEYSPHNLHQSFILPVPPSSSPSLSSRSKQKQQHNGGGLNPQSSSQLQMAAMQIVLDNNFALFAGGQFFLLLDGARCDSSLLLPAQRRELLCEQQLGPRCGSPMPKPLLCQCSGKWR